MHPQVWACCLGIPRTSIHPPPWAAPGLCPRSQPLSAQLEAENLGLNVPRQGCPRFKSLLR